jgi:hypothetical protein
MSRTEKRLTAARALAAVFVAWALPAVSPAAGNVGAPAKCLLILQCGSDWCESGEDVRRVFESAAFRKVMGKDFDYAVYDDCDAPTPAIRAANAKVAPWRVETKRFPAITCLTGGKRRFFAQLENIPYDVTAESLAERIGAAVKKKDLALRLFEAARRTGIDARRAAAYGGGLALLASQAGDFNEHVIRQGRLAWTLEWKELVNLDRGNRFGWRHRFESGNGLQFITKATKFRQDGDFTGGQAFVASLRAIPTNHLTVIQRQAIELTEYALWRKDTAHAEANIRLLQQALAMGRDTLWGQCALGYLVLAGRAEPGTFKGGAMTLRPRPDISDVRPPAFPLERIVTRLSVRKPETAAGEMSEADKRDIARYAFLRRIGEEGWQTLLARPGAMSFLKAFLFDRKWIEDFVWSGRCDDWVRAILALEEIVFQDDGRWIDGDNAGRRCATALALTLYGRTEDALADIFGAYRDTALEKRLHLLATRQPVWQWRIALTHMTGREGGEQQRFLDKYFNAPFAKYGGACWLLHWRLYNCFGESVHTPHYYEPWVQAGEWFKRRYTATIGGVCGELSTFGSSCANAHGLPSLPVGQPGHCAYTRRLPDGRWVINYSVTRGTGYRATLIPGAHTWTYTQAVEGTFAGDDEKRRHADRLLELASLKETLHRPSVDVAALYAAACRAWPTHLFAWRRRADWIVREKRPLGEYRQFAEEAAAALKLYRQPLWDLLTPYVERLGKERGPEPLAEGLVRLMPLLRQNEVRIQEEGFFGRMLMRWLRPLNAVPELKERVLLAALAAQASTRDYFTQIISDNGAFFVSDEKRLARFIDFLAKSGGGRGGAAKGFDFGGLARSASQAENVAAFHEIAAFHRRLKPAKRKGKTYPKASFGGRLLSEEGLLKTSSTCPSDTPLRYICALDAQALEGAAFHTDKEKSPWATVVLAGMSRVKGILVVNTPSNPARQVPIDVALSEDGKTWEDVFADETSRAEYRIDFGRKGRRAKYVRVRRRPGLREEPFHLSKILVYGDKLY